MDARYAAYVICATPRSGSTLLYDLLTTSGVAGRPRSYLRSQDVDRWATRWHIDGPASSADPRFNRSYLAAMLRAGKAGTAVFGLRMMWPSVAEAAIRFEAAFGGAKIDVADRIDRYFGPTLWVHLTRLDKVAQAVSLVRAEQTGLWHVAADGSERQRTAPARAPIFDAERIRAAHATIVAEDEQWARFFVERRVHPLRLTYEALSADPRAILADMLGALGRDPAAAMNVPVESSRMAGATSRRWIEQLDRR